VGGGHIVYYESWLMKWLITLWLNLRKGMIIFLEMDAFTLCHFATKDLPHYMGKVELALPL
jgi:hypothetical protein